MTGNAPAAAVTRTSQRAPRGLPTHWCRVRVHAPGRADQPGTFGNLWRGPARAADVPLGQGLHALRHYYASLLIRLGESVKTVQARLGHASATETLDTYSHLWPSSDDRTREAVDTVLGVQQVADSLRTNRGP